MGYWAVYKIVSGNVVERYKAWKSGGGPRPRGRRVKGSTGMKKLEQNRAGAIRRAARVLNANFSHADLLLTLNYDDAHLPGDWDCHERDRALFLERYKKRLKKLGLPAARWMSVCADKDGKTGREEHRHVHVVISGDGVAFRDGVWYLGDTPLREIWGKGGVWAEQLWDQDDYTGLAVYLLRQARTDAADWKQYHTSRNLIRPEPEEEQALTGRELRAPKGAVVMENHYDARSGSGYIRYVRKRKKSKAEAGETDCHGAARLAMTGKSGDGSPRRCAARNDGDGGDGSPRRLTPPRDDGKKTGAGGKGGGK